LVLSSRFFRRLFIPYLLLLCIATASVGFYAALRVRAGRLEQNRQSVDAADVNRELQSDYLAIGGVCLSAICVAAAICFYLTKKHSEPVRDVAAFANALSRGELNRRFHPSGGGEIGTLTTSLNSMAESLSRMIRQTTRDHAELSAILASMSEGVIAVDPALRILLANEKAAELLEFDAGSAVGKALWEVLRIEPILRAASDALAGSEIRAFPVSPTMGRHLEITVRQYPLTGRPSGLVIVAHDTTRSVRYQELRKEFVANVSHELRTPLTVIKGFTETLQDGALLDPEKGMQFLSTISKHVDQLTNLVNDLLELSRLEGSPELPRPVSMDIAALARRVTDLLAPAAQRKNQTLRLAAANLLPRILGNPDYIDRAIANLVDNAIKYTQEGGEVAVTVGRDDHDVFVEVADNGLGIPQDDIPRIFERFYRVDRSRSREMGGTGLGLSIVKHVVQVHGGSIDVSSSPGAGSKFKLYLPIPPDPT